jgi:hypothetical protein
MLHAWEGKEAHRIVVGRPEGKRLLGRPKHRFQSKIKIEMDFKEIG